MQNGQLKFTCASCGAGTTFFGIILVAEKRICEISIVGVSDMWKVHALSGQGTRPTSQFFTAPISLTVLKKKGNQPTGLSFKNAKFDFYTFVDKNRAPVM